MLATALMVALNPANVTGDVSVGNASGDIPAQKQWQSHHLMLGTHEDVAIVTKNGAPAAETKTSQCTASKV